MSKLRLVRPRQESASNYPGDLRGTGDSEMIRTTALRSEMLVKTSVSLESLKETLDHYGLVLVSDGLNQGCHHVVPGKFGSGEHKVQAAQMFHALLEMHAHDSNLRALIFAHNPFRHLMSDAGQGERRAPDPNQAIISRWHQESAALTVAPSVAFWLRQAGVAVFAGASDDASEVAKVTSRQLEDTRNAIVRAVQGIMSRKAA